MKNEKYYVGLDIGTDSVGYAVSDERYNLCKFKGEPMWGVTLFDEAQLAVERRIFRVARRRLERRQQRVRLVMELFAREISKIDEDFFRRIEESYLYPNSKEEKIRLFGSYAEQRAYVNKYPTIHHLIVELQKSTEPHDVRLVYIACAWLVAHRGHFLSEVEKQNIEGVTDFSSVYDRLIAYITRDEYCLPWNENADIEKIKDALKTKLGITKKAKLLSEALFEGAKPPKVIGEEYEYNYDLVVKILCGGKVALGALFGKEEYDTLDEKSVALNDDDEKLATIMQSLDDEDAEFIEVLKAIYDWSVLVDVLKGKQTISEAKVAIYEQHENDLKLLKSFIKKYAPQKYNDVFRSLSVKSNYVSYIGKNKTKNEVSKANGSASREDFCKYVLSVVRTITPDKEDVVLYNEMISRLEALDFMPKQVDGDNRVIPYQLYWYELSKILKNAKQYLTFLAEKNIDGITVEEKILSIFTFRVPYYVGPLKEKNEKEKLNHWMVRKAEGKIYPWNFDSMIDLDASEEAFISRMTNFCTYVPGEDVLPKNSLIYCAFEVLNEINNIKINGQDIPVSVKQEIYENVFMQSDKITPKRIRQYLESNGYANADDVMSGVDLTVKSSLRPFRMFKNLVWNGMLSYADVEAIVKRAAYTEDKKRFESWIRSQYPNLPESEIKYVSGLKLKGFGRLSKKLLCGIEGACKNTGETFSIIRAMWETNNNFMQLLSDKFTFAESLKKLANEYYATNHRSISERLEEMRVSNSVKRPIIRTLDILKDVVKIQGRAPEFIFIEMARGGKEDEKGKRTQSRLAQIQALYDKVKDEDVKQLKYQLDEWGDSAHNKLQNDKLFLYFIQLGRCLYTGKAISLESVISGDGTYNIEHIYPRSFVKDDSIINNKILVDSKANGEKSDTYPVDPTIQNKMRNYWSYLNEIGAMSDEKFKRLTRKTHFTEEEKFEFINRQLVETRQSTKALSVLLQEIYPDTEIVCVKAGLVSDFRKQFDLVKCRSVNDLHHAKDAYLNIVCGNVWYHKFSRQFWRAEDTHNVKTEIVFTRPVVCKGKSVWTGAEDKERVVKIARKNTAHVTKYSYCRKGGFFDQMPLSANEGLIPRKKNMPTEVYGGYNKTTASFFVLVRYQIAKKQDVLVMPVELLYATRFLNDEIFAEEYARKTIRNIVNKQVLKVEFLFNKRILKVNTMLSLNGLCVCITGKSSGGKKLGISVMNPFKTSVENETYLKKLESFKNKKKKNPNIIYNELYDGISKDKNLEIYDCYIKKLQQKPYKYRPANPINTLVEGRNAFTELSCELQVDILLDILGLFGRIQSADLTLIGGVSKAGVATLSSSISNWEKNYTDVRVIDRSASGLFETVSDNLFELL